MARYVLRQHVYDQILEALKEAGKEHLLAGALELTEISDPNPEEDDDDYRESINHEVAHDH